MLPKKKLLEETNTLMYFDSDINRDGMVEGKSLRHLLASNVSTNKENSR